MENCSMSDQICTKHKKRNIWFWSRYEWSHTVYSFFQSNNQVRRKEQDQVLPLELGLRALLKDATAI